MSKGRGGKRGGSPRGGSPSRSGGRGPQGRGRDDDRRGGKAVRNRKPQGGQGGRRPPERKGLGGDQVEGRQAVRELLLAGNRKVHEVMIEADQDDAEVLVDIRELAAGSRVPVREVSAGKLRSLARTEAPQGVVAKARALQGVETADLFDTSRKRPPLVLALDGVTDPGNLGAILRVAECAGVTGVLLPRHRSAHVSPTVAKTAAGAIEHVPLCEVAGIPAALEDAKQAGLWVVGLSDEGSRSVYDLHLVDEPLVLVFGAEGRGLSNLVRKRCDDVVSIPLVGEIGSLNVSTAVAVASFEIQRRRGRLGPTS